VRRKQESIFDDIDEGTEARAIAEAEAQIGAGLGVPHERVRKWLLELAAGKMVSPPRKHASQRPQMVAESIGANQKNEEGGR
jgi:hypothetical protein